MPLDEKNTNFTHTHVQLARRFFCDFVTPDQNESLESFFTTSLILPPQISRLLLRELLFSLRLMSQSCPRNAEEQNAVGIPTQDPTDTTYIGQAALLAGTVLAGYLLGPQKALHAKLERKGIWFQSPEQIILTLELLFGEPQTYSIPKTTTNEAKGETVSTQSVVTLQDELDRSLTSVPIQLPTTYRKLDTQLTSQTKMNAPAPTCKSHVESALQKTLSTAQAQAPVCVDETPALAATLTPHRTMPLQRHRPVLSHALNHHTTHST